MHPDELAERLASCARWAVLTGAGCSTASGIPDYRDVQGAWKRPPPMRYQEFVATARAQQRYWARALLGWQHMRGLQPNAAHRALARLQAQGRVSGLITQNVDGLHERAGSRGVIDLHGRMDRVECLHCGSVFAREEVHARLCALNPDWLGLHAQLNPDGDVQLETDFDRFRLAHCAYCGGALKPAVVFFGENVPAEHVSRASRIVGQADLLLVVGSSLMVYSGYRFVGMARRRGIPVVLINRGRTRADDEAMIKVEADCSVLLRQLAERLAPLAAGS